LRRLALSAAAALLVAGPALIVLLAPVAAAEPIVPGLNVTGTVVYRSTSFILTQSILVNAGGNLVLDNVSIQFRFDIENSREIRVLAGGTLVIVNGTRIYSQFQSTAYSLHYRVYIAPGGHFVLQNSTLDYPYMVGVGDETALIENSTISHALMGLYGSNLTVSRMKFFQTTVGMWLSGHSLVRDSDFQVSDVYGAILDGTSRIESSTFSGSQTADLALMQDAVSVNTTHRRSTRAAIVNENATMIGAQIDDMISGGVQVGSEDFRYGCGIFVQSPLIPYWPNPTADWLNLHLFDFYQRWNNSITLQDISVRNTPSAITFGREVWRRGLINDTPDNCTSDPPFQEANTRPLQNTITMRVTKPQEFIVLDTVFNGSLIIDPGASLTVRGANWRFLSPGPGASIVVNGGALVLDRARMTTGLVDYARDRINESQSAAPPFDIFLNGGPLTVHNSTLLHLGSSANPAVDAGIVVREGAGPVDIEGSAVEDSNRAVTLGCCAVPTTNATRVTIRDTVLTTTGPTLVLHGGVARVTNSTLGSTGSSPVLALGTGGELHLYSTLASPQGQGSLSLFRYGFVLVRAVWEDLRAAGGAPVTVSDFPGGNQIAALTAGQDGWVPPQFLLYRTTSWDGTTEVGQAPSLFVFSASKGGATASTLPIDISLGAEVTLALPDDLAPTISLDLPPVFYSNVSGGFVTGHAQDNETGITFVELSIDGGPFLSVLTPSSPLLGVVNFSFTLTGQVEAIHVLLVRAWDSVGNTGEASAYFIVDLHFPFLTQFDFAPITNKRAVNVSGKLNEAGTVTIKGNSTNASELDGSFRLPLYLDQDTEYVVISVRDLAGNAHDYSFVARLDEVPPNLEVNTPDNGSWTTAANVTIIGSIELDATFSLNGVPLSVSNTTSFQIRAALTEGENVLQLAATDAAGNRRSVTLTISYDSGAPELEILSPDPLKTLASPNVTLRLRTEPGVIITVGNSTVVAAFEIVEIPLQLSEGRNLLSVSVSDLAGNKVLRGLDLKVDTIAPTITFARAPPEPAVTLFLRGTTEPNALLVFGGYFVQADGQGSFSLPLHLHAGENVIEGVARDSAGNTGSATFTITVEAPPAAQAPGLAAPSGGPLVLLIVGVAAAIALPLVARQVAGRREKPNR
jgi:hypothetical protein